MDNNNFLKKFQLPVGAHTGIITKRYYSALSGLLRGMSIERHFTTLLIIGRTDAKCTQQYLSDLLEVDKVSMVRMLDYLVDKGMVKRSVNPDDRREHIISQTEKGKKAAKQVEKGIEGLNKTAFRRFSEKEQQLFIDLLARVTLNLSHLPGNSVDIKIKKLKKV